MPHFAHCTFLLLCVCTAQACSSSSPSGAQSTNTENAQGTSTGNAPSSPSAGADAGDGTDGGTTTPLLRILTQHNDAMRTGANLQETVLNTNNVSSAAFQKLYAIGVQGDVYAQPLFVEGLVIGGTKRNVLFVATEHNMVYAFDADTAPSAPALWQVNLGPSVPMTDFPGETNFATEIGITATPVIDMASLSMYVSAALKTPAATTAPAVYSHALFRLNLLTGQQMAHSPQTITASAQGTGYGAVDGQVTFTEPTNLQRASLLLANGTVYLGFSAHGITSAYHGWLLAYDANTLAQVTAFTSSPNSSASGIWQGGQGPAADTDGYVYACSSNGNNSNATGERIESLLKFQQTSEGMQLVDYFTPANWQTLDANDQDFGSTGVLLVPGLPMAINGDKAGNLYFSNTQNLGKLTATDSTLYQKLNMGTGTAYFAAPVYYHGPQGPRAYAWAQADVLKAWDVASTTIAQTPADASDPNDTIYMPGGILSVSASGTTAGTGIVWATIALNGTASGVERPGVLMAFDAANLKRLLYSTQTNSTRDAPGIFGKFNPPTIAQGKVYIGTFSNQVAVYGLKGG